MLRRPDRRHRTLRDLSERADYRARTWSMPPENGKVSASVRIASRSQLTMFLLCRQLCRLQSSTVLAAGACKVPDGGTMCFILGGSEVCGQHKTVFYTGLVH